MTKNELYHIITQGENETTEFKSSFGKEVIESIVAFSNSKGGKVIVGVNANKNIIGVSISDESIQKWINEIKQNTNPQVIPDAETLELEGKTVVLFRVIEYPVKPVAFRNKYYKRKANSNHLMSIEEIANEHLKTINSSWDFYPDPDHSIHNISIKKISQFIHNIEQKNHSEITISPVDFLSKLEFIRNNRITFGVYLLFAEDYCSISDLQIGRFKSDTLIIDSLSLNTDLFTEVDETIAFIKKHLMVEYIITGEPRRQERFDYPLEAIREIVINMIVHRDYRDSSGSIIKIFDDRIEFFNPGNLYGGITISDLLTDNYTSQARNKLIAKAFKEAGIIERYGSGIRRILSICNDYGIVPPRIEEVFNGFRVVLFKEKIKVTNNVVDNVGDNVGENRPDKILNVIEKNNKISAKQLSKLFSVSDRTIERDIEKLKAENKIIRIGGSKDGYWKIIDENEK